MIYPILAGFETVKARIPPFPKQADSLNGATIDLMGLTNDVVSTPPCG